MKKAEVIAKYAKALKGAKLKSYILAAASGVIAGLMYKVGVQAGANATCQKLTEMFPEDDYVSVGEAEANEDTN